MSLHLSNRRNFLKLLGLASALAPAAVAAESAGRLVFRDRRPYSDLSQCRIFETVKLGPGAFSERAIFTGPPCPDDLKFLITSVQLQPAPQTSLDDVGRFLNVGLNIGVNGRSLLSGDVDLLDFCNGLDLFPLGGVLVGPGDVLSARLVAPARRPLHDFPDGLEFEGDMKVSVILDGLLGRRV